MKADDLEAVNTKEGKIVYIPLGERELAKEIELRGKAEGKAEMARNLLAIGISPDIIAQSAGLSIEQVRSMTS